MPRRGRLRNPSLIGRHHLRYSRWVSNSLNAVHPENFFSDSILRRSVDSPEDKKAARSVIINSNFLILDIFSDLLHKNIGNSLSAAVAGNAS